MAATRGLGYSHTQRAPLSLLVYGTAVALFVGAWMTRGTFPVPLILAVSGAAAGLLAMAFHHLTVEDRGESLVIRFGPLPLFRIRGGWVWNLWGAGLRGRPPERRRRAADRHRRRRK